MGSPKESSPDLEYQLDWDDRLSQGWPTGPDHLFIMKRMAEVPVEATATNGPGRVLEVAAAEAVDSCQLNLRGMDSVVVEPSPAMLERAQQRVREHEARVTFIRGVAEHLPLRDGSFDRVLIDAAIDHLAHPDLGAREMTRVLKPDGRLVITFVNYASLSVRLSRLLYRAARLLAPAGKKRFWDTPVPFEHTFECTLPRLGQVCGPYLDLDRAFGVSIGWMVPGWGRLLGRLPEAWSARVLQRLDRIAHRQPAIADFVVSVWRPRAAPAADQMTSTNGHRPADRTPAYVVSPTDVIYPRKAKAEAEYWGRLPFGGFTAPLRAAQRQANEAYTGNRHRSWIEDLIGRGSFRDAAVLGCDEQSLERLWLERQASERLDVYELSEGVIRKVRAGLGLGRLAHWGPQRRVRFIRSDLNFVQLPEKRYDVIWSSGCLHHIVNLEHLLAQVEQALRPNGIFALNDYVGEPRLQFAPERLARINAVLREVPPQWRRSEAIVSPDLEGLSPFCGVRSDEILAVAKSRFDVLHERKAGALFPLSLAVDLNAIERDAPELMARLAAAEREAMLEPTAHPCGAYAVFRRRP